jgi:hypothetical protein
LKTKIKNSINFLPGDSIPHITVDNANSNFFFVEGNFSEKKCERNGRAANVDFIGPLSTPKTIKKKA